MPYILQVGALTFLACDGRYNDHYLKFTGKSVERIFLNGWHLEKLWATDHYLFLTFLTYNVLWEFLLPEYVIVLLSVLVKCIIHFILQ